MAVQTVDIEFKQNEDWEITCTVEDDTVDPAVAEDLTGFSFEAEIRHSEYSQTVYATISHTLTDPTNGVFSLSLTDVQTLAVPAGLHKWDLFAVYPDGYREAWFEGTVDVSPRYTR